MTSDTIQKVRQGAFLLLVAAAFLYFYATHPALPGNRTPDGWWGWFDQGEYLKEARAIARLDGDPANYFYPPLYPALGALFVGIAPVHPFTAVNLAAVLLFAHFFVRFGERHAGWPLSAAAFLVSFYPFDVPVDVWVEPWTSTLVAPLRAFLLLEADRLSRGGAPPGPRRSALLGALWSAAFLARPADAAAMAPLVLYLMLRCGEGAATAAQRLRAAAPLAGAAAAGVALFLAFNHVVHGSLFGKYVDVAVRQNGMFPADMAEKAVSLFADPGPLYNVPWAAVFARMKWLALAVPAGALALLAGGTALRLLAATALLHLAAYLPYSDLMPTGVWNYHNLHYLKWLFPYAALLVAWAGREAAGAPRWDRRRWGALGAALLAGAVAWCARIELSDAVPPPGRPALSGNPSAVRIDLGAGRAVRVDKVSFPTLVGRSLNDSYFNGRLSVRVDGRALSPYRDFRFLPAPAGTDLLFIRPVEASVLEVGLEGLVFAGPPDFRLFRYGFGLGAPAWLGEGGRG